MESLGGMRLRAGIASDIKAMYRLDVICFERPFRFSRGAMRRFAEAAGAFTLIAESDAAEMAGFLMVQVSAAGEAAEAYIVTLDVAPAMRRLGIARLLLDAAERKSAELGARHMTLHVWTENAAAVCFYERSGFTRTVLHPDFYASARSAYGYSKVLAS
jgi:ribosomal-protein-alanine N-acetyltransferase